MINYLSEYEGKYKKGTQSLMVITYTGGFRIVGKIVANEDGSIVIPPEIAAFIGIVPKTEYLVYERNGKILMIPHDRLFSLLDSMTDAMVEKMEAAGGFSDDTTFLFGLTAEEYFALSEKVNADFLRENGFLIKFDVSMKI